MEISTSYLLVCATATARLVVPSFRLLLQLEIVMNDVIFLSFLHHTYRSSVQQSTPIWLSAPMVDILWRPSPLLPQKVFTSPPNSETQPPCSNTAPYLPVTTRTDSTARYGTVPRYTVNCTVPVGDHPGGTVAVPDPALGGGAGAGTRARLAAVARAPQRWSRYLCFKTVMKAIFSVYLSQQRTQKQGTG